jgi:L-ascorbate metabolism protein UlaG (beta-lactamase superfamily)
MKENPFTVKHRYPAASRSVRLHALEVIINILRAAMPNSITFINHATVLIQLGRFSILTDPIYARTISFIFPRLQRPGIPFRDLPPIDWILVSHNDYDHLNVKTLRRLRRRGASIIVLPRGLGPYGRNAGFRDIVELGWWEEIEKGGLKITCTPARHVSKRRPRDRNSSACCGYVIQAEGRTVYFAGDTGYGDFFRELGQRYTIDVALLPIGAYKPHDWFKDVHLNPASTVQAFLDLRAQHLIPIHWGTFWISDEPMAEPPILLQKEAERQGIQSKVHVLKNGERFAF